MTGFSRSCLSASWAWAECRRGLSLHPGTPGACAKASSRPRKMHLCPERVGYGSCHLANAMDVSQGDIKWQEGVGRNSLEVQQLKDSALSLLGGGVRFLVIGTKMSQSQKTRVGWRRVTIHRRVTEPQPSTAVLFPTRRM